MSDDIQVNVSLSPDINIDVSQPEEVSMTIDTIVGVQGVGLPAGGALNQVLAKQSSANYDFMWQTPVDTGAAILNPRLVNVTTAAATAAKVGTTDDGTYTPATGDILLVSFSVSNTASTVTLNIDGSGAKSVLTGGVAAASVSLAGTKVLMWYDGTSYQLFGSQRTTDANTVYLAATSAPVTTSSTKTLAINNIDTANSATLVAYTLPATAAVGSTIEVIGLGAGGWRISVPSGDNVLIDGRNVAASETLTGAQYTTIQLRCVVANTSWVVTSFTGVIETSSGYKTNQHTLAGGWQ